MRMNSYKIVVLKTNIINCIKKISLILIVIFDNKLITN